MSDYKRLISYIYEYEGKTKGKNIGFVKLEARNGQCRLNVNVKKVYVGGNAVGVFLLGKGNQETFLGNIFIRNGAGEFRASVDARNVEGTGNDLDTYYGLTIHDVKNSWRSYTTIWEDSVAHMAQETLPGAEKKDPLEGQAVSSVVKEIEQEIAREEKRKTEGTDTEPEEDLRAHAAEVGLAVKYPESGTPAMEEYPPGGFERQPGRGSGDGNVIVNFPGRTFSQQGKMPAAPSGMFSGRGPELVSGIADEELPGTEIPAAPLSQQQPFPWRNQQPGTPPGGFGRQMRQPGFPAGLSFLNHFMNGQPQNFAGRPAAERQGQTGAAESAGSQTAPEQPAGSQNGDAASSAGGMGGNLREAAAPSAVGAGRNLGEAAVLTYDGAGSTPGGNAVPSSVGAGGTPGGGAAPSAVGVGGNVGGGHTPSAAMAAPDRTGGMPETAPPAAEAKTVPETAGTGGSSVHTENSAVSAPSVGIRSEEAAPVPGAGADPKSVPQGGNSAAIEPNFSGQTAPAQAQTQMPESQFPPSAARAEGNSVVTENMAQAAPTEETSPDTAGEENRAPEETVVSPELENEEVLKYLRDTEETAASPEKLWQELRKSYPKIQPFDYDDGCEILTIRPQDIGRLPRETWVYGNNSFLLHGYYSFRYLILVRLGNSKGRPRYLLGVPGHYYSNEKYMASMFGFPNFVLSKKQPPNDGRFGYWYTDVRMG